MVTIYALMSDDLVLYVGKTKHLKKREVEHRNGHSPCSKYIQEHPDWTMKVLEETTDALGTQREQYFYDTLDPLYNQCRPGQTSKERAQKENYKAYQKAYLKTYQQQESYKAYQKAYHLKKKSEAKTE